MSIKTSDYGITPYLSYYDTNNIRVKFVGGCLKQEPGSLFHAGLVNVYTAYEISKSINISDYPTRENCLFGAVWLTKEADIESIDILVMELDLIDMEVLDFLALD